MSSSHLHSIDQNREPPIATLEGGGNEIAQATFAKTNRSEIMFNEILRDKTRHCIKQLKKLRSKKTHQMVKK